MSPKVAHLSLNRIWKFSMARWLTRLMAPQGTNVYNVKIVNINNKKKKKTEKKRKEKDLTLNLKRNYIDQRH